MSAGRAVAPALLPRSRCPSSRPRSGAPTRSSTSPTCARSSSTTTSSSATSTSTSTSATPGARRLQGDLPRPARAGHRPSHQLRLPWAPPSSGRPSTWSRTPSCSPFARSGRAWPRTGSLGPTCSRSATPRRSTRRRACVAHLRAAPPGGGAGGGGGGGGDRAPLAGTPVLYYITLGPALLARGLDLHGGSPAVPDRALQARGLSGPSAALARPRRRAWPRSCASRTALFLLVPGSRGLGSGAASGGVGRGLAALAVMALAALVAFSPQLLAYHAVNGTYAPSRLVTRKMNWSSPHFLEVLFDPGHGLFVWSRRSSSWPRLASWPPSCGDEDALSALLVVALLAQVWINGAVESWTQAGAFGSRRFVGFLPVFAWGLAAVLVPLWTEQRRLALAIGAVAIWWNVSLMVQFGLRLMDRQRLEWPRVAVNQVTEVPRRVGRVAWLMLHRPRAARAGEVRDLARAAREGRLPGVPGGRGLPGLRAPGRPRHELRGLRGARRLCLRRAGQGPPPGRRGGAPVLLLRCPLSRGGERGLSGPRPRHGPRREDALPRPRVPGAPRHARTRNRSSPRA